MPFNTALSGIRAASNDLNITGNNIANASTTGYKASRAEFGDVYASSVLGAGSNPIGSGVRLQDVAQNFKDGNIAFTENELDLAVKGSGFFVVQKGGEQFYTRAGLFSLDVDGYIVNNGNARLQGFDADENGSVGGLQTDLRIQTSNLAPRPTTNVASNLNLDSSEKVKYSIGKTLTTTGNAVGVTQGGLEKPTSTTAIGNGFTMAGLTNNFTTSPMTFNVELTGAKAGNGTVSVNLSSGVGVPATITSLNELRTLAGVINAQLSKPTPPQTSIDVEAVAKDDTGGNYHLEFVARTTGESSQIRLLNSSANAAQLGFPAPAATIVSTTGIPNVTNGYPQQKIELVDPKGKVTTYTALAGATAAKTAAELGALIGVEATAITEATISAANFVNPNGAMVLTLNAVPLTGDTLPAIADQINALTRGSLPGISATVDAATGDLKITSSIGGDLHFQIASTNDGDSIQVTGNLDAPPQTLEVDTNNILNSPQALAAGTNSIVVGGTLNIVLDEGYTLQNANPPSVGLFGPLVSNAFTPITLNAFDPADVDTFNHSTTQTIFDSLGNAHQMQQYFVREKYDANDPATAPNHWKMYVLIDGKDIGDPDTSLPPPGNTLPTRSAYDIFFNPDGSINSTQTDDILISNWTPLDVNGNPNGSLGPQNVLAGGGVVIPDPPISSNFVIDVGKSTQFGSKFSVNNVKQNGYTTGRLSGLNIDPTGTIFARFTNGESQVLGQVALSNFANNQGLQPVGDSMWAENFESGAPNIGTPGSGALGAIQSGALEESNVDLSSELVNLIIAQRNFQANSKTIETANQVTQTIINLR
ncbi:MAG TPA: flagellar hook-basal body complex protein [Cellvibrionaceae bacterium]